MIYYILRLKSDNARVDRTKALSLEEATTFFMRRKQLDDKTFHNLYKVSEYE
mgnify:FL=1